MGNANQHSHVNVGSLMVGGAGGRHKPGKLRNIIEAGPTSNLLLSRAAHVRHRRDEHRRQHRRGLAGVGGGDMHETACAGRLLRFWCSRCLSAGRCAAGGGTRGRRGHEGATSPACARCSRSKADVNAPQADGTHGAALGGALGRCRRGRRC